ncbi:MAG: hypothetical protein AB1898_06025 [Acidobacteriota bacterium]
MTSLQQLISFTGLALNLGLIAMAVFKRRIPICYSFFAYLVVTFCFSLIVSWMYPLIGRFYYYKELILDLVKMLVLLELNRKIFQYYPRVRRANQIVLLGSTVVFALYNWLAPPPNVSRWFFLAADLHSKIVQTLCLVYLYMSYSILFYRLHILPAYKSLILGFITSQFPLALGFALVATYGDDIRPHVGYSNAAFFLLALVIWGRVYWPSDSGSHPINSVDPRGVGPAPAGQEKRSKGPFGLGAAPQPHERKDLSLSSDRDRDKPIDGGGGCQ